MSKKNKSIKHGNFSVDTQRQSTTVESTESANVVIPQKGLEAANSFEEPEDLEPKNLEAKNLEAKKEEAKNLDSFILQSTAKETAKVINQKPYTEHKESSLTKEQRIAVTMNIAKLQGRAIDLQKELISCFMGGDAILIEAAKIKFEASKLEIEEAEIEAAKLTNVDAKFKVAIKGKTGLDLLLAQWELSRKYTNIQLLELYKAQFEEGTDEHKKVSLYLSSKINVESNPILTEEAKEEQKIDIQN